MPIQAKVVHHETKYFFVGAELREVIFVVEAPSLDAAWELFRASAKGAERVLSVVKTETEIYLAG